MNIGFIGAGKVGFSLGKYLSSICKVVGYTSRNPKSAAEAACFTDSQAFDDIYDLIRACDTIFITVPDGEINNTWGSILCNRPDEPELFAGKNFCHCSGALASTALDQAEELGIYTYSLHPLYAVSSKTESYKELHKAFFALEGSPEHLADMEKLLQKLGNSYQIIDTHAKARYHAAAVMASNHVVGLYYMACEELVDCGFDPQAAEAALAPLFLGNAEHIVHDGCLKALTGPAERGDYGTINKHLDCIRSEHYDIYRLINLKLLEIAEKKHAAEGR